VHSRPRGGVLQQLCSADLPANIRVLSALAALAGIDQAPARPGQVEKRYSSLRPAFGLDALAKWVRTARHRARPLGRQSRLRVYAPKLPAAQRLSPLGRPTTCKRPYLALLSRWTLCLARNPKTRATIPCGGSTSARDPGGAVCPVGSACPARARLARTGIAARHSVGHPGG